MIPSENFSTFTARKLYIHNCGHAVLAYMGFLKGFQYGYEALTDPEIFTFLNNAWDESQAGIISHYAAPQEWLNNHRQDLLYRFKNRALGDTIVRLGRDPIRKLAANDRLVAPARMAENAGVQPLFLAKAIAAAYSFSTPEDPLSQQLQQDIASQGIEPVLLRISGISPHERLGELILAEYHRLQAGKVL
jgi:mannitol-1-phosphate 5-dehydrogenase